MVEGNWSTGQSTPGGSFTPMKPDVIGTNSGDFNVSTGVFTVPADGVYEFSAYWHCSTNQNERMLIVRDTSGNRLRDLKYAAPTETIIAFGGYAVYTATAGQLLTISAYANSGDTINAVYSHMAICKVG